MRSVATPTHLPVIQIALAFLVGVGAAFHLEEEVKVIYDVSLARGRVAELGVGSRGSQENG